MLFFFAADVSIFEIVKCSIAIQLAFVFLTGTVIDLHDLSKVPYLLQHFQQHKSKAQAFSIIEFFDLHYGGKAKQHDKQEHEQHQGLPFKTHDCAPFHANIDAYTFQPQVISTFVLTISYSNFYQSAFSSAFSQSIWQPPRLS